MKIAVIYQGVFPPVKGASGGDRRVRDMTIGISNHCGKTTLVIPKWQDKGILNKDIKYFDIKYLGSKFNRIPVINRLFFWIKAVRFLVAEKYEAVLFYNTSMDCIIFLLTLRLKGIKVAYEICDLNYPESKGFLKLNYFLIENFIPKLTNLNIGISDFICNHFSSVAPKIKNIKIPILVDPVAFTYSEEKGKNYRLKKNMSERDLLIAYAGGTWKAEGVSVLMNAVKLLQNKYSNIKLVIAGKPVKDDKRYDDIDSIASTMNQQQIELTGWITTEEILRIYSAADILVLPQLKNSFNRAALPTKLAEYSAMGKAIILADVGDVTQYFTNNFNAVVIEDSNVENMVSAIETIMNNEELRKKIGENAKKTSDTMFNRSLAGLKIIENL